MPAGQIREKSSRNDEFISASRAMRKTVRFVSFPDKENK
jgi:hypothetical protein